MESSREGVGRGQEIDCVKSEGFHICWDLMIAVFLGLALGMKYIFIFSGQFSR